MKEHCNVCLKLIELKEQLEVCQPCSSSLLSGLSKFVLNKKLKWSLMKMTLISTCFNLINYFQHSEQKGFVTELC